MSSAWTVNIFNNFSSLLMLEFDGDNRNVTSAQVPKHSGGKDKMKLRYVVCGLTR